MILSLRTRRRALALGTAALAALAAPVGAAHAQGAFPTRPITLVVPFAAGGSTDIIARLVAAKMTQTIGQQVVVENRAGAGGNIGAAAVAKAAPDGYTILMGTVSTHALNVAVYRNVPFDPVKDFEPVSLLANIPNVLIVHPSVQAKTVKELIDLAKREPDKLTYASSGIGTPLHLSGELFNSMAGVRMRHLPYRGAGPALNDVVAGQVPVMFDNLPSAIEQIRAGRVRGLGVTTAQRSPAIDLPTIAEAGLPGYETYSWNAFFAPAKTPKAIIDRLNQAANATLSDPELRQRFEQLSAIPVGTTPEALRKHVENEVAKWAPIVKASGAQLDG